MGSITWKLKEIQFQHAGDNGDFVPLKHFVRDSLASIDRIPEMMGCS